ncbi:uncharacterized protein A4U43_C08F21420 [Asparagus officinalis]|uniref:clavaminate synthase-like protein At3g21360 n=1 Tax=Asparagus officinalis TaxID=4686 RepID=UPI00098E37EE|nr:clavaminate synthase-like protein At3g21360 [Asparagus officinalis]ONK60682.1 uncharacterized protein A4U43_C08F21420 [Asparagus officinalis]
MSFIDGRIDGEKIFEGRVFPKILLPSKACEGNLIEIVKTEREKLEKMLKEHGAILFRGFDVRSAEDFSSVVEAFGHEEFPYQGPADRTKLADRVYTTNAVPLDVMISFHHEMAMIKEFPRRIMFFCMQPSPEGGETSIIPSNIIVEKMEEALPQVVEKFVEGGIFFVLHTKATYNKNGRVVWQRMLKTTDKIQGEKRAKEMLSCNTVKFNSDGTADFTFGPMNPVREFNGKRVMFNRILGYNTGERDAYVAFKDGRPIPLEATKVIERIYEDNCVDISWEKGDVLLVDNLTVQHARRPGKHPRIVLVSLSD